MVNTEQDLDRKKDLNYVDADDWAAVYVDGTLRYEGHHITKNQWFELLKEGPFNVDSKWADSPAAYGCTHDLGCFPETWKEFLTWTEM